MSSDLPDVWAELDAAVERCIDADVRLVEAMRATNRRGVTKNAIAERVHCLMSRPTALKQMKTD